MIFFAIKFMFEFKNWLFLVLNNKSLINFFQKFLHLTTEKYLKKNLLCRIILAFFSIIYFQSHNKIDRKYAETWTKNNSSILLFDKSIIFIPEALISLITLSLVSHQIAK